MSIAPASTRVGLADGQPAPRWPGFLPGGHPLPALSFLHVAATRDVVETAPWLVRNGLAAR